jgi:hypothetical protein
MARGRFLSTSVGTDDRLNHLSLQAQLLFLLTIPHLDRDGLCDGRPEVLWGLVAPLRADMRLQTGALIDEWVALGLVVRYMGNRSPVLFFPSFARHQAGMRYERESVSKFAPPPGFVRGNQGLIALPDPLAGDDAQQLIPVSGVCPAQSQGQAQGQAQGQVQSQRQSQAQVQGKDHHHHQAEAVPAATASHDDDDFSRMESEFDGGDFMRGDGPFPEGELVDAQIRELGQLPLERLRLAAQDQSRALKIWVGSRRFIASCDGERLASLLTWLRLYSILHEYGGWDPRAQEYDVNPFDGVRNPVGRIITQARNRTLAPLREEDLEQLRDELRGSGGRRLGSRA